MKYIKKTILSILIAASIVLMPISAYCLDTVYVSNPEIWYSDSRVVNMSEQNLENYNGIYSYYADTEHACFYLHISYNEKNLKNEGNDIKVEFQISNSMNKYAFIIDENGIIDADSELKQSFDTVCNFGEATKQGQEIYLGIELKNKADKTVDNTISFSVVVNGKTYNLANGILLPLYKEETTKVKANNKTTAVKETKKNNNTTNKSSTSKSSTEKTTKFKYVAPVTQKGGNKYTAEDYTYDNEYENAETSSESPQILTEKNVNTRSTLSRTSKILIAVAVIFIAIGIGVIIYNSTKTQKAKKNEQTDEE